MKSAVAIAALFTASFATAAPVEQRDACNPPSFQVSNFSAACVQHSSQCIYEFNLLAENQTVQCRSMLTSLGVGELPPVTAATCTDSPHTFSVTKLDDGRLVFTASVPLTPTSNLTGSRVLETALLAYQQDFASKAQVYSGPADFGLY